MLDQPSTNHEQSKPDTAAPQPNESSPAQEIQATEERGKTQSSDNKTDSNPVAPLEVLEVTEKVIARQSPMLSSPTAGSILNSFRSASSASCTQLGQESLLASFAFTYERCLVHSSVGRSGGGGGSTL